MRETEVLPSNTGVKMKVKLVRKSEFDDWRERRWRARPGG